MSEESNPENIIIPENPIEEIQAMLKTRDEQRRRALDLAWTDVEEAVTEEGRLSALSNLARMLYVNEEFRKMFPGVFPPDQV